MPGWNNSTNSFGPSRFVVGTVLGAGVFYTSIQTAIDDAFAFGGASVLIRVGTYTEDLTLRGGVDVLAVSTDGRLANEVNIIGSHTFTGSGATSIQGANLTAVGDLFTVSGTVVGVQALCVAKFCEISSSAGHIGTVTAVAGTQAILAFFECQGTAELSALEINDNSICSIILSTMGSNTAEFANLNSNSIIQGVHSNFSAQNATISINDMAAVADIEYTSLTANNAATFLFSAGGSAQSFHNIHNSGNASTNYVDGAIGNYVYGDDLITGFATNIAPTIGAFPYQWRPRATADVSGATAFAGTASFDSANFTVTDGFVQLVAPFVPFTWVDQPVSVGVNVNQGNFVTGAGVTLTMPGAPVQGDVCKFKATTTDTFVIQANGTQTLQVSNQTSIPLGTAINTQIGDALELTFYAAGNVWIANSQIGNWLVV